VIINIDPLYDGVVLEASNYFTEGGAQAAPDKRPEHIQEQEVIDINRERCQWARNSIHSIKLCHVVACIRLTDDQHVRVQTATANNNGPDNKQATK